MGYKLHVDFDQSGQEPRIVTVSNREEAEAVIRQRYPEADVSWEGSPEHGSLVLVGTAIKGGKEIAFIVQEFERESI